MIWLVLLSVAFVVPFWKLLPQFGISSWWAVTAVFPLCALILLYIMAFGADRKGGQG
ncbi:hypothetical protein [Roseovarius salis]|uniref:hypothetical protein n=1 Tax=Roseovarius salis TaxID=3376063 RepID=UPI0037CAE9A0